MNENKIIEVTGLCKSFGPLDVVRDVSFSSAEHEVVSMIGASGSGKSTILRCINLLEMPDKGDIYIDGEKIPLSDIGRQVRKITNHGLLRKI